jgi:hypothetical protein
MTFTASSPRALDPKSRKMGDGTVSTCPPFRGMPIALSDVRFQGLSGHSPQWLSHTFKISLQMRESREINF